MLLGIVLIAVVAYLLGSIPVGYLLVRIFRTRTSARSAAATSALPTFSALAARAWARPRSCSICSKAALPSGSADFSARFFCPRTPLRSAQALAALCAVLGHMFPIWLRFRGGKGVATGFGVFLVAAPWAALAAISVFFIVLFLTRYVSLASILGAACFPFFAWFLVARGPAPAPSSSPSQCAVALLIIVKHHQNIRRLLAGTESRFGARKTA